MSVKGEKNAPPHYRRYGSGGGGRGGSAFHSGKSYKKVGSSNAQGVQARVNALNPNVNASMGYSNSSAGGQATAHIQHALRGRPVASSTSAAIKPADASVQKSTPGLPKAPQTNVVPLNSGTKGPSTPVKGPPDASGTFSLQFGSISPGVINGMQVPARTSSATPNSDEQKRVVKQLTNCVPYSVRIELLVVKQLTLEKKMLFKRRKKAHLLILKTLILLMKPFQMLIDLKDKQEV